LLLLQLQLKVMLQLHQLLLLQCQPMNLVETSKYPNFQDNSLNITTLPQKQLKLKKIESKIFPKAKSLPSLKILDQLLKNLDNNKKLSLVQKNQDLHMLRKKQLK